MKKILSVAIFLSILFQSSFAMAAEEKQNPLYGGAGFALFSDDEGLPLSSQEMQFYSNPGYGSSRTENNQDFGGNFFIGFQFSDNFSAEFGYLSDGKGFESATTGFVPGNKPNVNGVRGESIMVPFAMVQKMSFSALHVSAIGKYPLRRNVKLFGRIGLIETQTNWSQTLTYNCNPVSCDPFQVWSHSSIKTGPLFGLGVEVKATKRITLRAEAVNSDVLHSRITPKMDLVFYF